MVTAQRAAVDGSIRWRDAAPPLLAAALSVAAVALHVRGGDLAAGIYRVGLFHRHGLTLWDSQWYSGHWTLDYSVLFPAIAGLAGIKVTEVLSAAGAAWTFDRIIRGHFGRAGAFGSALFATGTLAQVAIGQLPFLLGEALALGSFWAALRGRRGLAAALAALASLSSPLAGAFLVLAAATAAVADRRFRFAAAAAAAGAAAPLFVVRVLFPGSGIMPFPAIQLWTLLAMLAGLAIVVGGQHRGLRIGLGAYAIAAVACFVIASPVGSNMTRLAACVGAPIAVSTVARSRRWLVAAATVPLVILQWNPVYGAVAARGDLSIHATYFSPLIAYLERHASPLGRVEVVPTALHWEAARVAPRIMLARGWERQLDRAYNPLFYGDDLDAAAYGGWLRDNGVRFVALPDARLDYAGRPEAALIAAGVGALTPVWSNRHWRVFSVRGSPGIVVGPARATAMTPTSVDLDVFAAGPVRVRVHYSADWTVTKGIGCVTRDGDWLSVDAPGPGHIRLELRLLHRDACRRSPVAVS